MIGDKTTTAQMQQLMKKIQGIQLECMSKIHGLSFNVALMTQKGWNGRMDDSISVSLSPFNENTSFTFYAFWSIEQNQKELDRLRAYVKQMKTAEGKNDDVFK